MRASTKKSPALTVTAMATVALFLAMEMFRFGGLSSRALAQEEPAPNKRVSVFVLPSSDAEGSAALLVQRVLRENVKGLQAVDLVVPAPVVNAAALPQLTQTIEEAYQALNGKRVPEALEKLNGARGMLEQLLPLVSVRTVALFYKAYGVAQVLSGNVIEGRPAIEMSLSLLKEQTNLEYAYSVEVLQLYGQIVSDLERRPSAKLIVESRPENAVVVVDSREAMQSPATLTNLMAGPHLVRVTRDGYEQWAGFVTVKGGEDNVISVPLKAIPDKDVFDQRLVAAAGVMRKSPEEAKAALGDLKAFLGTDELLVLECGVVAESYELKGFQVKADGTVLPIKRAITRDANFLASVKEFLSGLFESFYELSKKAEGLGGPPIDPTILQKAGITAEQTTGVFDPDNPVFPTIDIKKKDESLTSKWWFWVGAGVLVGGAVAGGLALALAQGSGAGPTGTLQVDINCPQK